MFYIFIVFVANLKNILNLLNDDEIGKSTISEVMDKLQPLITAANIGNFVKYKRNEKLFKKFFFFLAVDECDFGNSIESGRLFFAMDQNIYIQFC